MISAIKKLALIAGAVASIMGIFTVSAAAQNKFGSIYYSQRTGVHGYSYNFGSQYQAEQAALNECLHAGGTDCRQATWFRNACGALAVGHNRLWGSHWGVNRHQAEQRALNACYGVTGGCRIVRWVCTDR